MLEVEKVKGKAIAQSREFSSMEGAVNAFGHGPESGKDFPVTVKSTSIINSSKSPTELAKGIVNAWNAKGLSYPTTGYPGRGQGNCHSFTHFVAASLRIPHPERATREAGWYQLHVGWERGQDIYNGN